MTGILLSCPHYYNEDFGGWNRLAVRERAAGALAVACPVPQAKAMPLRDLHMHESGWDHLPYAFSQLKVG